MWVIRKLPEVVPMQTEGKTKALKRGRGKRKLGKWLSCPFQPTDRPLLKVNTWIFLVTCTSDIRITSIHTYIPIVVVNQNKQNHVIFYLPRGALGTPRGFGLAIISDSSFWFPRELYTWRIVPLVEQPHNPCLLFQRGWKEFNDPRGRSRHKGKSGYNNHK